MDLIDQCHKVWQCRSMEIELAEASAKLVEQHAEIERLRAALQMIAEYHRGGHLDTDEKLERDLMIGIARAALKGK
jgi:hypothetical protein